MAVALAQCGFRVQAIDTVEAMVELARHQALERGASRELSVDSGDVYALTFADASFDLVIAAGVLPWLERVDLAIKAMARVTKPGGYIILTTANPLGLPYLLDPLANPVLRPLKERVKSVLERAAFRQCLPGMAFHGNRYMSKALARAGLIKAREMTLGFEFSLFRHKLLPEPLATALYHRLQRLADRNVLGFGSLGMSYHVLARKSAPPQTFGDKREEEVNEREAKLSQNMDQASSARLMCSANCLMCADGCLPSCWRAGAPSARRRLSPRHASWLFV